MLKRFSQVKRHYPNCPRFSLAMTLHVRFSG